MLELEEGINFRELGGYLTEDGRKVAQTITLWKYGTTNQE